MDSLAILLSSERRRHPHDIVERGLAAVGGLISVFGQTERHREREKKRNPARLDTYIARLPSYFIKLPVGR